MGGFCVVAAVLLVSTRTQFVVVIGKGTYGSFVENSKGGFLRRCNCFLMILSLRELQWGVRLVHFALFY